MSGGDVSCIAPATRHAFLQILFEGPTPAPTPSIVFERVAKTFRFCSFFARCNALATKNDARTSKSGPNMQCFKHFDFRNVRRFAAHYFQQLSCQKRSQNQVFLAF